MIEEREKGRGRGGRAIKGGKDENTLRFYDIFWPECLEVELSVCRSSLPHLIQSIGWWPAKKAEAPLPAIDSAWERCVQRLANQH